MRIALQHTSEVGVRAGRILLGERNLERLGLVDGRPAETDPRVTSARDLGEFDVLASDTHEAADSIIGKCLGAGIDCVVWGEPPSAESRRSSMETVVLIGSNLASGVAPCLAAHEAAVAGEIDDISLAWTEPGTPLRRGEPIPFPEPVGAKWAVRRSQTTPRAFVAPVAGDWAAALARVSSSDRNGSVTRVVGVADLAVHLEALALVAGVLAVADGAYRPGLRSPADAPQAYLDRALRLGLEVASYISRE